MNTIKMTINFADGSWIDNVEFPAKKEVCSHCEGEGKHSNPNIDDNGITGSEMDELGDDFRENYLSGVYDVVCHKCKGLRVVDVIDESQCTKEQLTALEEHNKLECESRAEEDAERRFFARFEQ